MKICSWNVNGLRAILKKGDLMEFIAAQDPDIICLQETKARPGQAELDLPEYTEYWQSAERAGYSGTAVFSKTAARQLPEQRLGCRDNYGDLDSEGRLLTLDYGKFYLVNTYVPNSKPDLSRLATRYELWDPALREYLAKLQREKPVIACGDFNAAHREIDIARPKQNEHSAGFTAEEREGIDRLLAVGLVDSFRSLHPDKVQYTWWSMRGGARIRNVGWRIDYFFVSDSLLGSLKIAEIHDEVMGSDHAPIVIEVEL